MVQPTQVEVLQDELRRDPRVILVQTLKSRPYYADFDWPVQIVHYVVATPGDTYDVAELNQLAATLLPSRKPDDTDTLQLVGAGGFRPPMRQYDEVLGHTRLTGEFRLDSGITQLPPGFKPNGTRKYTKTFIRAHRVVLYPAVELATSLSADHDGHVKLLVSWFDFPDAVKSNLCAMVAAAAARR